MLHYVLKHYSYKLDRKSPKSRSWVLRIQMVRETTRIGKTWCRRNQQEFI